MIMEVKSENFQSIRDRFKNVASVRPYCSTCSEVQIDDESLRLNQIRYHQHISSLQYRVDTPLDDNGQYACSQCEVSPHYAKCGDRYPILVTSSILSQWQGRNWRARAATGYKGDVIHIDQLSLPGGRIRDLQTALRAEYSKSDIPLDVLVAGGINDIINHAGAGEIIKQLTDWKAEVTSWNPESTFSVCTMPYPPSITFLSQDYHLHREAVKNRDKTAVINELNPAIVQLNQQGPQGNITARAPRLTTWGLRQSLVELNNNNAEVNRSVGRLTAHRSRQWRERQSDRQLHFDDRSRFRLGKATVAYFRRMYGLPSAPDRMPDPGPVVSNVEQTEQDKEAEPEKLIQDWLENLEREKEENITAGQSNWCELSDISDDDLQSGEDDVEGKILEDKKDPQPKQDQQLAIGRLLERVPTMYNVRNIVLELVDNAVDLAVAGEQA
jgi:hypothetical protein